MSGTARGCRGQTGRGRSPKGASARAGRLTRRARGREYRSVVRRQKRCQARATLRSVSSRRRPAPRRCRRCEGACGPAARGICASCGSRLADFDRESDCFRSYDFGLASTTDRPARRPSTTSELTAVRLEPCAHARSEQVDLGEADVVAVAGISRTGIAETDHERALRHARVGVTRFRTHDAAPSVEQRRWSVADYSSAAGGVSGGAPASLSASGLSSTMPSSLAASAASASSSSADGAS